MPRPISWLPRLHTIRKAVAGSSRSHYGRADLETLFDLKPRAAQQLLQILPTVQVGTSRLVESSALAEFLDGVQKADDTSSFIETRRESKAKVSRKPLRTLVRKDLSPMTLSSLPQNIRLERGRLEISFTRVEELAQSMYAIARLLEDEGDSFISSFELEHKAADTLEVDELRVLYEDLEQRERSQHIRP